jgi:hypothetical protein
MNGWPSFGAWTTGKWMGEWTIAMPNDWREEWGVVQPRDGLSILQFVFALSKLSRLCCSSTVHHVRTSIHGTQA